MKDVRFFRGYDIMNMQQEGMDMRILIKNASLVFEDRVEKGDLLTVRKCPDEASGPAAESR